MTYLAMKDFFIEAIALSIIKSMKELEEYSYLNEKEYQNDLNNQLIITLLNYYNKCYHDYHQKTNLNIVEKINKISLSKNKNNEVIYKHPICVFNLLFENTKIWVVLLSNKTKYLFSLRRKEDPYEEINSWLEENYDCIDFSIKNSCHNCGECSQIKNYDPNENLFYFGDKAKELLKNIL
jgi:hypothetical protein